MYHIGHVIKAPPTFTIILTLRFVPKHSYMLFAFPGKQERWGFGALLQKAAPFGGKAEQYPEAENLPHCRATD